MSESTVFFQTADDDIQQVPPQRGPKMSLRQRMLSPGLEQQQFSQQDKSPSPEVTYSPSSSTSSAAAVMPEPISGSVAGNGEGMSVEGGGSPTEVSDIERGLLERFSKMDESNRSWTEKGTQCMRAIDKELRNIDGIVAGFTSEIKEASRLEADIKKLEKENQISKETARQMLERVKKTKKDMVQAKHKVEPRTAGFISEILTGKFNVKLYREGERYVMKSKYEEFKQRSAIPFIVLTVLSFIFPHSSLVKTVLFSFCLFYYVSLAFRETILRANGSSVKPWWIIHHYLSAVASIVALSWQMTSESYKQTQQLVNIYSIVQVIVQEIQTQYQLGRLYKMVAMGKANPMDVTNEVTPHRWIPNIDFLYPFVTSIQIFQLYLSYTFFITGIHLHTREWHVYTMGVLFLVLGLGNIIATNEAYIFRWRFYHPRRVPENPDSSSSSSIPDSTIASSSPSATSPSSPTSATIPSSSPTA